MVSTVCVRVNDCVLRSSTIPLGLRMSAVLTLLPCVKENISQYNKENPHSYSGF